MKMATFSKELSGGFGLVGNMPNIKATMKKCTIIGVVCATGGFVGGLIGGPIGIAVGSTVGSCIGAKVIGAFRSVPAVLESDLTSNQKNTLKECGKQALHGLFLDLLASIPALFKCKTREEIWRMLERVVAPAISTLICELITYIFKLFADKGIPSKFIAF